MQLRKTTLISGFCFKASLNFSIAHRDFTIRSRNVKRINAVSITNLFEANHRRTPGRNERALYRLATRGCDKRFKRCGPEPAFMNTIVLCLKHHHHKIREL